MTVLGKYFLVLQQQADLTSPSGLFIPASAQTKPNRGKVVAVSEHLNNSAAWLKEGATVCFISGAGVPVVVDGIEHLILTEKLVLAFYD